MENKNKLEELERRVIGLEHEAYKLKRMIMALKLEDVSKSETIKTPSQMKSKKPSQKEPIDWEKRIGKIWLPTIFIFVLLIGVIWAFKAASNYGLINEPVKIIIGYIASAVLIFLGQKQFQKKRIALGQVLLSGSIVLLFIVTFAMHVLYRLVPVIPAFMLNIGWILLGIYFSHRYKSQLLSILTGIGGYLIPFLIESANPSMINFVAFETLFYLALLFFALKKKFIILYHVSFALFHFTFLIGVLLLTHDDTKIFALAASLQHIFLLLAFFINRFFINQQIGVLFTSFLLTATWLKSAYPDTSYEIMLLVIFAIYAVISILVWKKCKTQLSLTLSVSSFALMLFFANKFEMRDVSGFFIVQGMASLYLGIIAASKLKKGVGAFIYFIGVVATIFNPFAQFFTIEFLNWTVLIVSLFLLRILLCQSQSLKENDKKSLGLILYILTLIFIYYFVTLIANALTFEQTQNIQSMVMSFSWAIYAFICMILGVKKEDKILRVFGLILLFLTLAKLVFIDLSSLSLSIRAVLFIVLGLIGMVISRIYYKA